AAAAPALVEFAASGHDGDPDADLADRALAALALVAPTQAAPLLARDLGRRPRALDAAAGFRAPADSPFPFDAELLAAVRAPLAVARALYELNGESTALLAGLAQGLSGGHRGVADAAQVAGELGAEAAPLAPALREAVSGTDAPHISPVLDADTAVAAALWQI